jgi:hypothetical protein
LRETSEQGFATVGNSKTFDGVLADSKDVMSGWDGFIPSTDGAGPFVDWEGCATFVEEKDRIAVPIDTQILQR